MVKRNENAAHEGSGKGQGNELVQAVSRRLAYVQVASSELTRDINRDLVLERVSALQPVSRVDLARATGLQPSTISSIVAQLLAERWIRESAQIRTSRGRRPTLLSLNDDMVILVADIRATQAVVALVDLNGRFLERQVVPLGDNIEKGVDKIAEVMRTFRLRNPNRTVEGVGVSLPGRVDPGSGQILIAPNLRWPKFNLQAALENALGGKVDLENAANASLLAELWFGHIDGIRNAVLVTISEGLGAAILAEGRLIVGKAGSPASSAMSASTHPGRFAAAGSEDAGRCTRPRVRRCAITRN